MQILTIRKGFEAFECKFEPFERDSKGSNANSNHSKGIRKHSNGNSNHSKGIGIIQLQIRTIQKGFIAFECRFEPFERYSKHSNANSNRSKLIRRVQIQIRTIRKGFAAF